MYSIAFLKLVSFVQVNYWCRTHSRNAERSFQKRVRAPSMIDLPSENHTPHSQKGTVRGIVGLWSLYLLCGIAE